MAEHGEWTKKGATLSDVTAKDEYGVDREFILNGIKAGSLEFRDGVIWGNPYLRVLRSQLENYIAVELGRDYLVKAKNQTELRSVKKEISTPCLKGTGKTYNARIPIGIQYYSRWLQPPDGEKPRSSS